MLSSPVSAIGRVAGAIAAKGVSRPTTFKGTFIAEVSLLTCGLDTCTGTQVQVYAPPGSFGATRPPVLYEVDLTIERLIKKDTG